MVSTSPTTIASARGQFLAGCFSALGVASVKHDAVAFAGEQIGRHQAEAGGRSRNEDA
jgi:hypothetical protein